MKVVLLLTKDAWSESASTSRDSVLKRALRSGESASALDCCTKVSSRPRLTRLSRDFEIRSPMRPIRCITARMSRETLRRRPGEAKMPADSSSRSALTRSRMSALRSMTDSSRPARIMDAELDAAAWRSA